MFRTKVTLVDFVAVAIVIFALLLLIALPLFSFEEGQTLIVATPAGDRVYDLHVAQELEIVSNGITLCVVIEDGGAYVLQSDCPDGVCVASGRISHDGEMILCAPAGVTLTVKGGGSGVDFVAG